MRIGIMSGAVEGPDRSLEGLLALAKRVEDLGFATLWLAQIFGLDAIKRLSDVEGPTFLFAHCSFPTTPTYSGATGP